MASARGVMENNNVSNLSDHFLITFDDQDSHRDDTKENNPLKEIFNSIDVDGSGTLDRSEIKQLFLSTMEQMKDNSQGEDDGNILKNKSINDEELELLLDRIDSDGDGQIDYQEFVQAFHDAKTIEDLIDTSYLHLLFSKIDRDNSDTIDHDEILQLFANATMMTESDKAKILMLIDADGDGTISFKEFKDAFRSLGCKSEDDLVEKCYLRLVFNKIDDNKNNLLEVEEWRNLFMQEHIALTEKELYDLIEVIDENHDGTIDFLEFERAFKKIKSVPELIKKSRLHVIFSSIDTDGSGQLDFDEIKYLFQQEQVNVSDDNLHFLIDVIDEDGDGQISFDEFENAFDEIESIDDLVNKWSQLKSVDIGSDLSISSAIHSTNDLSFATILPIIAGGTGGICSRTATAPLERVKIMAQCGTTKDSMFQTWGKIIRSQGFFRGLWRGNLINCVRVFPFGGLVTFSYGNITRILPLQNSNNEYMYRFGAGVAAGGIATTLTYPLDLIRTQIQASMSSEKVNLKKLVGVQGFRNMFKGLWPTLFAMSLFVGAQNASYDYLRLHATARDGLGLKPSVELFVGCGIAAGLFAQTTIYPLDVIRRRIQIGSETVKAAPVQLQTASGKMAVNILTTTKARDVVANQTWVALNNVIKREGIKSIFAGLTPTYLKVVPSVAISVTVRDILLGRLNPED